MRRARCAPEQTLWNTVWEGYTVLSPLSHIVKTTTGYIASQETIHYEIPFLKICTLLFLDTIPKRMQLCVVALWRYYWLNQANTKRARPTPNIISLGHVHMYHNRIFPRRAGHVPEETLWNTVSKGMCPALLFTS